MNRLRGYVIALAGLLATLFCAGQLHFGSIDAAITPLYVHVLTAIYVAAVIGVPRLASRSSLSLASVIVVGYLLAHSYESDPSNWWSRDATYLAVLEMVIASMAVLVAQRVALSLSEFEDAVANITIGDAARIKPLDLATDEIAVEMSRARRYERPLTVTIMSVEPASIQASLHRIVRDVQRAMMQRYILSGLARVAAQRTRRGDIVVQDTSANRIIIISPEASPAQVETLGHRLRDSAEATLGLPVRLGVAGFPHNALTFEDLVNAAASDSQAMQDAARERDLVLHHNPNGVPSPELSGALYRDRDEATVHLSETPAKPGKQLVSLRVDD